MKLPNHQATVVPREKVVEYLLSPSHRDGRHKAAFFRSFGFTPDDWQELATALCQHAAAYDLAEAETSPYGTRYVVEGIMPMPNGRTAFVRSVWFIDSGDAIPRFVTAYPLRRQKVD